MYSAWADSFNAQMYEKYAQAYPIYRETGKKLVELADIRPGMSVVDLACGTGIVTERIASALEGTGSVIAIDLSATMLLTSIEGTKDAGQHGRYIGKERFCDA